MKIVECIPNISEGKNESTINQVARQVEKVSGVHLLNVDAGDSTNRTVITFAGSPDAALEAAYLVIERAAQLIDMRTQKGLHPRLGATDVCPFVPISNVSLEVCTELARKLGKRVGENLKIPVYLYENAATKPHRRNLADIRRGEWESLKKRIETNEWRPDFGPCKWSEKVAKSGTTQIGARPILVAYNVNLKTKDVSIAKKIARVVRKSSQLTHCKALGWYIEEFGCAQVTLNLTDYTVTPPHVVFDAICGIAEERGIEVDGSEIVGLVPLEVMLQAGRHYLDKKGKKESASEKELIGEAIESMGLNRVKSFEPEQRIIEECMKAQFKHR